MVFLAYRHYRWHWLGGRAAFNSRYRGNEVADLSQDDTARINGGAR